MSILASTGYLAYQLPFYVTQLALTQYSIWSSVHMEILDLTIVYCSFHCMYIEAIIIEGSKCLSDQ